MNEEEKQKYLDMQINKVKGCKVIDLETERQNEAIILKRIRLASPNGDEFNVLPIDREQLQVVQIFWRIN